MREKYLKLFLLLIVILLLSLTVFTYIKMDEENDLLNNFIKDNLSKRELTSREDTVLAISDAIYRNTNNWVLKDSMDWYSKWEATGFFKMSTGVGLKYKCYGIKGQPSDGPCGTMTKIFLRAMWELGIPARKLQLSEYIPGKGGHTMAEFFDNGKWRVISPSDSSFVWRNPAGSIATVKDIQSDTAVFNQVYHKWRKNWQYGFRETWNINWDKIPGFIRSTIKFFIGEEAYRNAETPEIYENPRKLLFIVSLTLTILFFALFIYIRNRKIKI